jgi:hypothetical protein
MTVAVLAEKTARPIRSQLAIICGCASLFLVVMTVIVARRAPGGYYVFGTYWESGRAVINGLNPYAAYPNTFRLDFSPVGGQPATPDLNLNPPCFLPYFQALAHLSINQFVVAQTFISGLCFAIGSILLVLRYPKLQGRQAFWLLSSFPAIAALSGGQIYSLLFLLATFALLFPTYRPLTIGLLVALKPTMIFWPVLLFFAGHRLLALYSVAVCAFVSALPLAFYGPEVYREWLAALAHDPHWVDPKDIAWMPLLLRFGHPLIGKAAAVITGLALALWAYRNRPGFVSASGVGIIAGIICSPLGWSSYVLFLAPFLVTRPWRVPVTLAAAVFLMPITLLDATKGILYVAAVLLMLWFFLALDDNDNLIVCRPGRAVGKDRGDAAC